MPYTVKSIDEMEAVYGGGFVKARAELGITSFGVQVLEVPPNNSQHPEHDHAEDGQEEVYLVLRGSAELQVDGDTVALEAGSTMVAVPAGTARKLVTGDESARVLVMGGVPGKAYEIVEFTELGAPDPLAQ